MQLPSLKDYCLQVAIVVILLASLWLFLWLSALAYTGCQSYDDFGYAIGTGCRFFSVLTWTSVCGAGVLMGLISYWWVQRLVVLSNEAE